MRSRQFFLILSQARNLKEKEEITRLHEMCFVSSVAAGDNKYFQEILRMFREKYQSLVSDDTSAYVSDGKTKKKLPEQLKPVIDSASVEAKYAMMGIFSRMRH